jgi:hypothetical protein
VGSQCQPERRAEHRAYGVAPLQKDQSVPIVVDKQLV